jgi:hypothetical protein
MALAGGLFRVTTNILPCVSVAMDLSSPAEFVVIAVACLPWDSPGNAQLLDLDIK